MPDLIAEAPPTRRSSGPEARALAVDVLRGPSLYSPPPRPSPGSFFCCAQVSEQRKIIKAPEGLSLLEGGLDSSHLGALCSAEWGRAHKFASRRLIDRPRRPVLSLLHSLENRPGLRAQRGLLRARAHQCQSELRPRGEQARRTCANADENRKGNKKNGKISKV